MPPASLAELNARLVACERCPRLRAYCRAVAVEKRRAYRDQEYWGRPVPGQGDPAARVLLVGLAPSAHGANRTGRMFTGDPSADFLTAALYRTGFANQPTSVHKDDGLRLRDLYMVAAAHCAPPDNRPTAAELANCQPYLAEHLARLPNVRVLLALGKIGFEALLTALAAAGLRPADPRPAFGHGLSYPVGRYTLLGSYHPSPQNTNRGRLTPAMLDAVLAQARALAELG
ncbi:MAG: uracil-DNA glycosylase [Anaerolineales bacterium]|nr:uracil-DNA glycosylase [Anaerolineales bacterium]